MFGFLGEKKGGEPVPMRKSEINRILGKVDELAVGDEHINIPFVVGETVKVIDGPFNSFHAEIEGIDEVNVDVDEERDGNREVMNEQDQTERIEAAKLKLNNTLQRINATK